MASLLVQKRQAVHGTAGFNPAGDSDDENDDILCSRCSSLDLEKLLDKIMADPAPFFSSFQETSPLCHLGSLPAELATSECSLCRLLFASRWQPEENIRDCEYCLVIFSGKAGNILDVARKSSRNQDPVTNRTMLGVVPWSWCLSKPEWLFYPHSFANEYAYIDFKSSKVASTDSTFIRRILPHQIDYGVVRGWLSYCIENHSCPVQTISISFPGFKLIDCLTRKVIQAPDRPEYVALSYVWGGTQLQACPKDLNQGAIPRTIEDAISVVSNLEYRYLWVDYYCIDQENRQEKQFQIDNMDRIYAGAAVTIIASAGQDSSSGLPRVGPTCRIPQSLAAVGGYSLLSFIPTKASRKLVMDSTWASRAWTHQEAILSRRRLMFTSKQVLFECKSMDCHEILSEPLDDAYGVDSMQPKQPGRSHREGLNLFLSADGEDSVARSWCDHISSYTKRRLSFSSDALNAMRGIFQDILKRDPRVREIWGLPILHPDHLDPSKIFATGPNECLLFSLRWERWRHAEEKSTSCTTASRRISSFPSWSWAGWNLPMAMKFRLSDHPYVIARQERSDAIFSLELENGNILNWTEVVNSPAYVDLLSQASKYLHVQALIVKIRFTYDAEEQEYRFWAQGFEAKNVFFDENPVLGSRFCELLLNEEWDGIVLSFAPVPLPRAVILIIRRAGDTLNGNYERVGIVNAKPTPDWSPESASERRSIRLG